MRISWTDESDDKPAIRLEIGEDIAVSVTRKDEEWTVELTASNPDDDAPTVVQLDENSPVLLVDTRAND